MNRLFTLCIIALCCAYIPQARAQKCKFEKDETDAFTKERCKLSAQLKMCEIPYWWIQMEQKGTKYFFNFTIFAMKEVRQSIAKGTKILAKLEDGTVIEFFAENDVPPTANVEQYNVYSQAYVVTQWNVRVPVTEEQLKHFSTSPVTQMRTTIGDTETNMPDAVEKYTKKVVNMALCMLKND